MSWYSDFRDGIESIGLKNVLSILDEMELIDGHESKEKIDALTNSVRSISLTSEQAQLVIAQFPDAAKTASKHVEPIDVLALRFIRDKLGRKIRVFRNRVNRAVSPEFGQYIRRLREEKDYSLQDVATEAELSPAYINRLEIGKRRKPSYGVIEKLAIVLGADLVTLLELAGVKHKQQPVEEFSQVMYSANLSINGDVVSPQQKETLIELATKLKSVAWDERSKVKDSIEIMALVDQFKQLEEVPV